MQVYDVHAARLLLVGTFEGVVQLGACRATLAARGMPQDWKQCVMGVDVVPLVFSKPRTSRLQNRPSETLGTLLSLVLFELRAEKQEVLV